MKKLTSISKHLAGLALIVTGQLDYSLMQGPFLKTQGNGVLAQTIEMLLSGNPVQQVMVTI